MHSRDENPVMIGTAATRRRYDDISPTTFWRWQRDPDLGFPKAMVVAGRKYFRLTDLEAWEQAQLARRDQAEAHGRRPRSPIAA